MFKEEVYELMKQFSDDPMLESDVKLIISSLKLDLPETKLNAKQIKSLINTFIEGLEIGGK